MWKEEHIPESRTRFTCYIPKSIISNNTGDWNISPDLKRKDTLNMVNRSYDLKTDTYIFRVSKEELKNAFSDRKAYKDFILNNFGLRLTDVELEKMEVKE